MSRRDAESSTAGATSTATIPATPAAATTGERRVILAMNVTLDGYVSGPGGELDWLWPTLDPAVNGEIEAFLQGVDTILIGHETYLEQAAQWPDQTGPVPDLLNRHLKVVFSSRLGELTWNNSRLAKADAATEVARLKEEPGKDIYVTGGATLAQSLTRLGLIDEYHLLIHPTVLGAGRRLFADVPSTAGLTLLGTKAFGTGAIRADYRRT